MRKNWKSIVAGAAVLSMVLAVPVSAKSADDFDDVHQGDWYYEYVADMAAQEIMTGKTETHFGAAENLKRADVATIFYRLDNNEAVEFEQIYPDVTDGWFYSIPITWANQAGVITGYEDGTFGPTDNITREQMATVLYRYATAVGRDDVNTRGDYSAFPDGSKVSEFASEAMQWAVGTGIIKGQDSGYLDPQGKLSRAACAAMLSRLGTWYKPVWDMQEHIICTEETCGEDLTNLTDEELGQHMYEHMEKGENGGYSSEAIYEKVQEGYWE